jgi:hypothetical protein
MSKRVAEESTIGRMGRGERPLCGECLKEITESLYEFGGPGSFACESCVRAYCRKAGHTSQKAIMEDLKCRACCATEWIRRSKSQLRAT